MKTRHQRNCLKIGIACCLIMSLTLVGCFSGWSKKDKVLYMGFVGLNAIDTYQTFDAFDDPNKRELNLCQGLSAEWEDRALHENFRT